MSDPRCVEIPPAFWRDITTEDLLEMIENGDRLTPRLKARLYRMMDIQNPPDGEIQIVIKRADLDKLLQTLPSPRKRKLWR